MSEYLKYIPIIMPSILGFSMALFCNVGSNSGAIVNFRPPPIVFSIVWTILYILLGISWYCALEDNDLDKNKVNMFYILLNIFLCLWVYIYSCKNDKKTGIYIIILCIIFSLFCYTVGNLNSKLLIVPLIGLLLLATLLNVFEVEKL